MLRLTINSFALVVIEVNMNTFIISLDISRKWDGLIQVQILTINVVK